MLYSHCIKLAGRGFGFVHFKTEWDSNRAIQRLNGRMVGGRCIGVQREKYSDRNGRQSSQKVSIIEKRVLPLFPSKNQDQDDVQREF